MPWLFPSPSALPGPAAGSTEEPAPGVCLERVSTVGTLEGAGGMEGQCLPSAVSPSLQQHQHLGEVESARKAFSGSAGCPPYVAACPSLGMWLRSRSGSASVVGSPGGAAGTRSCLATPGACE